MSAPLRPAPRTRTSRSESPGTGSGCSSTPMELSRMVAARIGRGWYLPPAGSPRRDSSLSGGLDLWSRVGAGSKVSCITAGILGVATGPAMSLLPALPRVPPLWRESRIGFEAAALRRSPVFRGLGVPPGERRPVLLVPGFMAGDLSLGTMASWLRRAGYCTHRTGIRANFDCSEEACQRLEARLEHMAERHGERVVVIGQSRGGVFAKALAARRPELVQGIVTLGSPSVSQLAVHPLVLAQVGLVSALGTARLPGMFSISCLRGKCCSAFRDALEGPFPEDV